MDRLLPRRLSREIEVAWGLALGFLLNGVLMIAQARAGVVVTIGDVFQTNAVAGALGGLIMAMIHFVGQALSEERTPAHKKVKAAVEGVCAVITGAIAAHYFTRQLASWVPGVDQADVLWIGWAIGVFAWRVMPALIALAVMLAQPRVMLSFATGWLRDMLNKAASASSAGEPK